MYVTKELHATTFVAGRGKIGTEIVTKQRRCEIFRETLAMIAGLPDIHMFNAISKRGQEKGLFERLVNRINRTMAEWRSHALIVHDEGKDYTSLIRRMAVYNPIRSKYGRWPDGKEFKNIPTDRILEDIVFSKVASIGSYSNGRLLCVCSFSQRMSSQLEIQIWSRSRF